MVAAFLVAVRCASPKPAGTVMTAPLMGALSFARALATSRDSTAAETSSGRMCVARDCDGVTATTQMDQRLS